ncbi:protease inhibitor Inh/omp19 family protein [Rhizobium sp. L1K21]|uniref:protease inhibitor Inh/omp19 family protein n=1 Tax=Rhizobium sp. L1K21 TaxID=2954933 RepID=UPI002092FF4F|nr:protease inhibitor Inh/omp19 family protein [Rhizobium sp. L1K21]MCO6184887.1 protease inhibitor Inh/omp19 family protein [Rhizobium sp. L1K21]
MRAAYVAAGLGVLLALTGCQRTSYSGLSPQYSAPPLAPQPVPGVQSGNLSDPTMADPNAFPAKPEATTVDPQVAAAGAQDVSKEAILGNWKATNNGLTCDLFLTLTKFGSGSRGGTRGCVGELTTMRSWNVVGKQVVLFDANGSPLARLYRTADNRFDGATANGQPVSLSR